jgi:small subunit ribosomal protein S8
MIVLGAHQLRGCIMIKNIMVNHTVSDMITRVRNAIRVKKSTVRVRSTYVTKSISEILKREGYIADYKIMSDDLTRTIASKKISETDRHPMESLELILKYHGKKMTPVFTNLKSISRPGVRFYAGTKEIPQVLDGLGISILSTSKGIVTDHDARKMGIGGEILCMIW